MRITYMQRTGCLNVNVLTNYIVVHINIKQSTFQYSHLSLKRKKKIIFSSKMNSSFIYFSPQELISKYLQSIFLVILRSRETYLTNPSPISSLSSLSIPNPYLTDRSLASGKRQRSTTPPPPAQNSLMDRPNFILFS